MKQQHYYTSITSEEAAFKAEGIDMASLDEMFKEVPEKFRANAIVSFRRTVVMSAINGPHVAKWGNTNEEKWLPVWRVVPQNDGSGVFGLSLNDVYYGDTYAYVGARHVLQTKEQGQHYADNFRELDVEFYSR